MSGRLASTGRADDGDTMLHISRSRDGPIPIRIANARRMRVRFARARDIDRSGLERDNFVLWRGWSVRFYIEKLHVGRFVADGRRRQNASVCDSLLQQSASVLLERLLFCSGQHAALFAVAERLEVGDFSLPWMTCA